MCLQQLTQTRVPIVASIIGEGGSGGALALGIADHVLMLEHSVYSVASPEGCAAILWGDSAKAEEAASRLKLTSADLQQFGIIDEIVAEPLGGAHRDPTGVVSNVLDAVSAAVERLARISPQELREARYQKYRRIGAWQTERQGDIGTPTR
jgi:acetyl-CoA carboxylase carboxyl transferase subunit alpha